MEIFFKKNSSTPCDAAACCGRRAAHDVVGPPRSFFFKHFSVFFVSSLAVDPNIACDPPPPKKNKNHKMNRRNPKKRNEKKKLFLGFFLFGWDFLWSQKKVNGVFVHRFESYWSGLWGQWWVDFFLFQKELSNKWFPSIRDGISNTFGERYRWEWSVEQIVGPIRGMQASNHHDDRVGSNLKRKKPLQLWSAR